MESAPGASARREGQRRAAARERRIRERHRRIGGLILALTDEPQTTKSWSKGAAGEEKVGALLDGIGGVVVLHDRIVPGRSRATSTTSS